DLINNVEIRGMRGPRRFGPPPDARGLGRPENGVFVAPAVPDPSAPAPAGSAPSPNGSVPGAIAVPTPPGGPAGPRDGQERGGRLRPPPEGRGPGEPPRGQVEEP